MPPRTLTVRMAGHYGGTACKVVLHDAEVDAMHALIHLDPQSFDPCAGCGMQGEPECLECGEHVTNVRRSFPTLRGKLHDLITIADGGDKPSLTVKPDKPTTLTNPTKAIGQIAGWVGRVAEMDTYEINGDCSLSYGQLRGCKLGRDALDSLSVLRELLPTVEKHLRFVEKAFRKTHDYPPVLGCPME